MPTNPMQSGSDSNQPGVPGSRLPAPGATPLTDRQWRGTICVAPGFLCGEDPSFCLGSQRVTSRRCRRRATLSAGGALRVYRVRLWRCDRRRTLPLAARWPKGAPAPLIPAVKPEESGLRGVPGLRRSIHLARASGGLERGPGTADNEATHMDTIKTVAHDRHFHTVELRR